VIIKDVEANHRRKRITITTKKGDLFLPFNKLRLIPVNDNKVVDIYVDPELAKRAITYVLEDGTEDSIHLDAFLEFHNDPDFTKNTHLHKLTVKANEAFKDSGLSKTDVSTLLGTSRSQLDRLLDTANYKKSIDDVIRLLDVLGYEMEIEFKKKAS
jgi:predicted XRE-type DNA-binding protein